MKPTLTALAMSSLLLGQQQFMRICENGRCRLVPVEAATVIENTSAAALPAAAGVQAAYSPAAGYFVQGRWYPGKIAVRTTVRVAAVPVRVAARTTRVAARVSYRVGRGVVRVATWPARRLLGRRCR